MDVSAEVGTFNGHSTHDAVVTGVVAVPTIFGSTVTLAAETLLPQGSSHGWLRRITVNGAPIDFDSPKSIGPGDVINIDFR
jgi:hypothetical protein